MRPLEDFIIQIITLFIGKFKVRRAMKFKVEVDAISWEVNTYIIEAGSEVELEIDLLEGNEEGIIELIETHSQTRTITNIRSNKPYTETP